MTDSNERLKELEQQKISLITLLLETQNEILAIKSNEYTLKQCPEGCTCFTCEGKWLFYEEFVLFADPDSPRGEYKTDELKIYYYLENFSDESDTVVTISHEWLHGLIDWATEEPKYKGRQLEDHKTNGDKDHFIMKILAFG